MANNFCRLLSNGYSFQHDTYTNKLVVKPCCWFDGQFLLDENIVVNRSSYDSVTDWIPECHQCKELEDANQQSLRQSGFHWIEENNHNQPIMVDVYLDNSCNSACVICNESLSTLWYKEKQKQQNSVIEIKPYGADASVKIKQIDQLFDFSHLKYVKFFGGEPLFSDTHKEFLKKIPHPENVTVHYTTNGSIFPNSETLEIWKRFKTIIFSASLDAIGEQFNYIRWPLPWNKVSDNLIRLKNQNLHNVMFRVECTVNFLNAWYVDQLENWVKDHWATNNFEDQTEINLHRCYGVFDLQRMPTQLREEILQKYPNTHIIHNMIANLKEPWDLQPFFTFVNTWDQRRSTFWDQSFLDIKHFIFNK